jgi:two-component system, sensor histidine kinase RegB
MSDPVQFAAHKAQGGPQEPLTLRVGEMAGPALGGIRLRSLILTRWLAIAGQTFALLFVEFVLRFDFPLLACSAMVLASICLNLVATTFFPANKRLTDRETALYLAFDIIQLSTLLFLTGGLQNPFFILVLAPVAISASSLSLRSTMLIVVLAILCVSLVGLLSLPLPWGDDELFSLPPMYQVGLWMAIVLGIGFVAIYAWRIAFEARSMTEAFAATQFVLAREQRLSAVGGLAAAAAHELGTPLGTIALVANDLAETTLDNEELKDDIALMLSQVERCRKILRQLSADPHIGDAVYDKMDLGTLLHELAEGVQAGGPLVRVHLLPHDRFADGEELAEEPVLARRPEIIYGLSNFLNNAIDFADKEVVVTADWDETQVMVEVCDDGPGFSSQVMERLGEPYFTTRPKHGVNVGHGDHEGLGLGVFIAKTLIGHTGGQISFHNRQDKDRPGRTNEQQEVAEHGAIVRVTWPNGIADQKILMDGF